MIATGFCSGMARTGGFCGALSGAIMGLGLLSGRSAPHGSVEENYEKVQKLLAEFETQYGSTNCEELTGCHLGTDEGQTKFRATNQHTKCLEYAEFATQTVTSLGEIKIHE